jgi:hypothetical protein
MRNRKLVTFMIVIMFSCLLSIWLIKKLNNNYKHIRWAGVSYTFDYTTIVENLRSGGSKGLFQPYEYSEASKWFQNSDDITWTMEDYFLIAKAYHEEMWGELLGDWYIESVFYYSPCDEDIFTPQGAQFQFNRISKKGDQRILSESSISLWPLEEYGVYGLQDDYVLEFPRDLSGKVSSLSIFPWEAFDIAEKNGGEEYRVDKGSSCGVSINYIGNWRISYYVRAGGDEGFEKEFFSVIIDSETGEVEGIVTED